jgi:hypothetical protein
MSMDCRYSFFTLSTIPVENFVNKLSEDTCKAEET